MLRILLLSDLHAISGDPDASESPSNLTLRPTHGGATLNPLRSIPEILSREKLTVDWVLSRVIWATTPTRQRSDLPGRASSDSGGKSQRGTSSELRGTTTWILVLSTTTSIPKGIYSP